MHYIHFHHKIDFYRGPATVSPSVIKLATMSQLIWKSILRASPATSVSSPSRFSLISISTVANNANKNYTTPNVGCEYYANRIARVPYHSALSMPWFHQGWKHQCRSIHCLPIPNVPTKLTWNDDDLKVIRASYRYNIVPRPCNPNCLSYTRL